MACKLLPAQLCFILILPPIFDQPGFNFYNHNTVIATMHFKSVFTKANLFLRVESQMMPGHIHWNVCAIVSAKKFVEFIASMINLFIRWFDVERVFSETIRGFPSITFIPSV